VVADRVDVDGPAVHGIAALGQRLVHELLRRVLLTAQRGIADQLAREGDLAVPVRVDGGEEARRQLFVGRCGRHHPSSARSLRGQRRQLLSTGDGIRSGRRSSHWERNMRLVITLLVGMLALTACNTFEGMGRDVQDAGEAIEDEAQEE
jgi:predicted small secreted protein